ncbi:MULTISPECIES: recombinase family protein [Streptomycetaceae]|uniref:Resolvase/invertase-type recombinase catalytic domain-containing protein n=1 Tax=Streptantibioticus cattleyicolor (strain ATCC 35852 / DSM 46488 / JCM 4925 / NBRC 14057 / NRRL 8057) TaxID=1003195 RepID=F8JPQ4_STREN|nr:MULTISPECIES: recombinase family protein [Streptomycetaceae]AEW92745.1 hypothetical protein SCATT_03740 [Streptantibioticus cattleyicolor NRRL 8057 = DSM 46488]MYS57510.1 recombinase family protein [Streptomyces sp. SID5468]CCB73100.1 conserved protein of unknown function [Streptantibioticus cattleyicolor NRRL 8057 = DSM 46488]
MRPQMYGYMRMAATVEDDEEMESVRRAMRTYAEREGFTLGHVFTENATTSESAFFTLLDAIKRTEVKNVIVPSLWHFARLPGLQTAMQQHIEQETGAHLWVIQGQQR